MHQLLAYLCTYLVLFGLAFAGAPSADAASPPNIVILMVDDLGWNHISAAQVTMGTHDPSYYTPNLERLAREGLSFTHAYAQPNCAPTRAAMLSGQYPARVNNSVYVVGNLNRHGRGGISKADAKFSGPQQSNDVAASAITIAEALKKNGKTYEAYIYPGVNHGFHNDSTPRYDEAAAKLAWGRTIEWFKRYLA